MNSQNITEAILALEKELERTKIGADTIWLNSCGYIIFFMQVGFCLLESGSSRHKHHLHTIYLQLLNAFGTIFGWWILGFAFAYGLDHSNFIGAKYFAGDAFLDDPVKLGEWIFDMGSCTTAGKIVSGAILERIFPYTYFFFAIFMGAWIYPVGIHWAWHEDGWLKNLGYVDHAGSGVVHMVGGASALTACIIIGPRLFKFPKKNETDDETKKREMYNHVNFEANFISYTAIGTLLLWYCWYGFNCGSSHAAVSTDLQDNSILIGLVGINTTVATVAGGISALIIQYISFRKSGKPEDRYNIGLTCNGLLSGAVAVTAGCGTIYPYAAFIIGFMAGFIYYFYQWLIHKLHIDDPLHAGPIHLGTGSWGVAAVGIFHRQEGFLYGGGGKLFGVQLLGMICYFAWSFGHALIFFFIFKKLKLLRISEEDEIKGDVSAFGGIYMFNYDEESIKYYTSIFSNHMIHSEKINNHKYNINNNINSTPRDCKCSTRKCSAVQIPCYTSCVQASNGCTVATVASAVVSWSKQTLLQTKS